MNATWDRFAAAVRLLGNDDITPTGRRVLERVIAAETASGEQDVDDCSIGTAPLGQGRRSVDQSRLYASTDASVWAEEFAKVFPEVDQGTMIGWFANAIEVGRSSGVAQARKAFRIALEKSL